MGELIANVPVEDLVYYGPEPPFDYLDRMTAAIKAGPQHTPIINVRRIGENKFEIISKIQTFRACVQAGMTEIHVDVLGLSDQGVKLAQLMSSWEYVPKKGNNG